MGFKLGTERGNYAVSGEIRTKMRFDKESGDPDAPGYKYGPGYESTEEKTIPVTKK